MIVGVPKEVKADEYRIAMLPVGAEELTAAGHAVLDRGGGGARQRDPRMSFIPSAGRDDGPRRLGDLGEAPT